MAEKIIPPAVGIVISIILSGLGVAVARLIEGDVMISMIAMHAAAGIVLLVMILARLEANSGGK